MIRSRELSCHPTTPNAAVRGIGVRVSCAPGGLLGLAFALDGALERLRIPEPRPPGVGEELWRDTCFEAFVAVEGAAAYHELNLSPSGEWALFAFRDYRERLPLAEAPVAPRIAVRRQGDRLELDAELCLEGLVPTAPARPALLLALAAVVEETNGARSYWALRHPPGRPDFHHRHGFALRMEPPGGAC